MLAVSAQMDPAGPVSFALIAALFSRLQQLAIGQLKLGHSPMTQRKLMGRIGLNLFRVFYSINTVLDLLMIQCARFTTQSTSRLPFYPGDASQPGYTVTISEE